MGYEKTEDARVRRSSLDITDTRRALAVSGPVDRMNIAMFAGGVDRLESLRVCRSSRDGPT